MPEPRTYLLYHPLTRPGGRALAAALDVPAGTGLRGEPDVVIRWGSRRPIDRRGALVLNHAAAIGRASDKLVAFERMAAAGVPVPDFGTAEDAAGWQADGSTVLGRTRRQSRGRGIVVYPPGSTIAAGHEVYTRLVPDVRDEYRLHVVRDEVIRVQRKIGTGDGLIRSHAAGYRYVGLTSRRLHSDRLRASCEAVGALGLDFGAVDMLVTRDGSAVVLEVNTAPSCSPLTLATWADRLRGLVADGAGLAGLRPGSGPDGLDAAACGLVDGSAAAAGLDVAGLDVAAGLPAAGLRIPRPGDCPEGGTPIE